MKNIFFKPMISGIIATALTITNIYAIDQENSSKECTSGQKLKSIVSNTIENGAGLYFSQADKRSSPPFFKYEDGATEESNKLRENMRSKQFLSKDQNILNEYPKYIRIHEPKSKVSWREAERYDYSNYSCHQYALAKVLGYKDKVTWITGLFRLDLFDCADYFEPTEQPEEGNPVVYYDKCTTNTPKHFGYMGRNQMVCSTWGGDSENVFMHPPFLAPSEYGDFIIVWKPKEGKTLASIREEIETKVNKRGF